MKMKSIQKWLLAAYGELPAFYGLCRAIAQLLLLKVRKEDCTTAIGEVVSLQKCSQKAQIVVCGCVAVLFVVVMRGCADSASAESSLKLGATRSEGMSTLGESLPAVPLPPLPRSEDESLTAQDAVARIVNVPLDTLVHLREPLPKEGDIWQIMSKGVRISQVLQGGVVALSEDLSPSPVPPKAFFVATWRKYADGDVLACGYYLSTGIRSFETVSGASRTLYAFIELPEVLQNEMTSILSDNKNKELQERAASRKKWEQESEMRQKIWRTPDEYIKNGFCINLNDSGKVEEFIHRQNSEMSISWQEFLKDSGAARTELFRKKADFHEYRKNLILLYAKWLCDNNLSDTKLFLDRFMPKLKLDIAENIIVQKSLRSKLSINYDRGFIEKLKEMQKKRDWVGLLNVAFRDTALQITQIPTRWEVCSSGISRLANLAVKVEIAPTADTKIRIMVDEVDVDEFRVVPTRSFRNPSHSSFSERNVYIGTVRFGEKAYLREQSSDVAIKALCKEFVSRKSKIEDEYRLSMDPNTEEKKQRMQALRKEFLVAYEKWFELN